MNACRPLQYEGDFGSKFWLLLPSQSKGGGVGGGGVGEVFKVISNLVNSMFCDFGLVRVDPPSPPL